MLFRVSANSAHNMEVLLSWYSMANKKCAPDFRRAQNVVVGRECLDGALLTTQSIKPKMKKSMEQKSEPKNKYDLDSLYRYIVRYKRARDGNSPTYRDIMSACRYSSPSMVRLYLKKLERGGFIRLLPSGGARSIVVVGGEWFPPTKMQLPHQGN